MHADCCERCFYCRWLRCCSRSQVKSLCSCFVAFLLRLGVQLFSAWLPVITLTKCISRAIFGGPSSGQHESNAVASPQQAQEAPCTSQMNAFAKCLPRAHRSARFRQRLRRCMQTNNDNFQACSFYFDMMKQCKASVGQI